MKRSGRCATLGCFVVCAVLVVGCVGPPRRSPASEAQSEQLQQVQAQLQEVTASLEDLNRRLGELGTRTDALGEELTRARRAAPLVPLDLGPTPPPAEGSPNAEPMQDFEVAGVTLGMLTGGADWDGRPGDDGIVVYLYPMDQSDDTVKRAGDCTFELFDLSRSDHPLAMTWHVPAAQAADLWQTFPGCYRFTLTWQGSPPKTSEPILKVTFAALSGEEFTSTKHLRLHLPAAGKRSE